VITQPTVLILGAGASIDYGFPSGLQLKAEICLAIKHKTDIFSDLAKFVNNDNHVFDFYENLLLSSEMSIDAFLEHNPKYFEIGRRAIANILLRKEKHNELFDNWIDKWLDSSNKDKHWYQLLFSKLNAPFEEFEKNCLKIITFNYDRSLEYFLLKSMRAKYSEQNQEAILAKLNNISIHVYGKLGSLPDYDTEGSKVPYDLFSQPQAKEIHLWRQCVYDASQYIITVHQAKEIKTVIEKAQEYLLDASRIYFLGFGYDKTNMERLFLRYGTNLLKWENLGNKCLGTALGISPHHKEYLIQLGLAHIVTDRDEEDCERHRPARFPNSTIYDFLYFNPYSRLD